MFTLMTIFGNIYALNIVKILKKISYDILNKQIPRHRIPHNLPEFPLIAYRTRIIRNRKTYGIAVNEIP
jgi:hypothetical protein